MKFNIGDKVVVNSKSAKLFEGLVGIIKKVNENGFDYIVDVEKYPYSLVSPVEAGFNEYELDFETTNQNVTTTPVTNLIVQTGSSLIKSVYNDCYITPIIGNKVSFSNSHSCTWKTYTGLMYKEEYCDCGATKNRRGIYE